MNYEDKFRICSAIEIRQNGMQHHAFSIQRKNMLGFWVNVTYQYIEGYSTKKVIPTFLTIADAQKQIDDIIRKIKSNNVIHTKTKQIDFKIVDNTEVRILKTFKKYESGCILRQFHIQTRKPFSRWKDVKESQVSFCSFESVLVRNTYKEILIPFNKVIDNIERKNSTSVSSSIINL